MIILNVTQPLTLILLLISTVLLIFLGRELKKSYITAIPLVSFIVLLFVHVFQLLTISTEYINNSSILIWCIVVDGIFIFLSLLSYLWIDGLEAKAKNKKSIDNSLDWFWKEV